MTMGKEEEDDKGGRKGEGGVEFTCALPAKSVRVSE